MAIIHRDYGKLGELNPNDPPIEVVKRRQVYQATHGGDGSRLPYMYRSFISFTFGGKAIEDFNLIATIESNSLNRTGYSQFEDTTSNYSNLDGQQYWATHAKTNSIDFTLVTDGMDQRMLDDFLHWFRPGNTRELILSEHPNRAILARVGQPPQLNLLPFEEPATVTISDIDFKTSTTLYKGNISLSLIMDDPYWYALMNVLGKKDNTMDRYLDLWYDVTTDSWVEIEYSKDALKVLYEDGIPMGSMIQLDMLLGNGVYANISGNTNSKVWEPQISAEDIAYYDSETNTWSEPEAGMTIGEGARVEADNSTPPYNLGTISGAVISASGNGIDTLSKHLSTDNESTNVGYFYYAGTAPSPTIITFTMEPKLDLETGYIMNPASSFVKNENNSYNSLFIESKDLLELRFTTPNVFTSYNKAIKLFTDHVTLNTTDSWEDLRQLVRDEIRHIRVREWAIHTIELCKSQSITTLSAQIKVEMRKFLLSSAEATAIESSYLPFTLSPVTFTFNSYTGEATGKFSYRLVTSDTSLTSNIEENVGDMLQSNYIIIRDRNYMTSEGTVTGWTTAHPEYSHRIYHDCTVPLKNISIDYKNMYL